MTRVRPRRRRKCRPTCVRSWAHTRDACAAHSKTAGNRQAVLSPGLGQHATESAVRFRTPIQQPILTPTRSSPAACPRCRTTRLIPRTSLMIRFDARPSSAYGRCAQCAVMKSVVCTRAQRRHVVVRAAIAHHAHRLHRQEHRERLARQVVPALADIGFAAQAGSRILRGRGRVAQFLDEDRVRAAAGPRTRASLRRESARRGPDPGTDGGTPSPAAGRARRPARALRPEQTRSGSSSLRPSVSGRPPTLWWLLIVVAFFVFVPPDSTTSG